MNSIAEKYLEKNKNINRGFRKLEVWKETVELFSFVKKRLKTLNELSFKTKAKLKIQPYMFHRLLLKDIADVILKRIYSTIQLPYLHWERTIHKSLHFLIPAK